MAKFTIFCLLSTFLCLFAPTSSEKQLKLEDIEKDNLKSAQQQTKVEKQFQQIQQYQQSPVHYDQQVYTQQGLGYPSAFSQYLVPQQYVQQQHQQFYSGYAPLTSNSLSAAYPSTSSIQPFQNYYTPQIAAAVQSLQGGQHIASSTQAQPIIMTIPAATLSGLQQQAYYQVIPKALGNLGGLQFVPAQTGQAARYYYQPQPTHQAATSTAGLIYAAPQQFIPSFQPSSNNKVGSYQQQYLSTSPQTFSTPLVGSDSDYVAPYQTQGTAFSSNPVYQQQSEQPTFVSLKAPQHHVASPGQQQQYLQAQNPQTTTISPFKYLNSPQYLAQNYNTIQASHLLQKNSFSSGIKSTVTPPVKITGNTGYITPSSSSSNNNNNNNNNNNAISYQTYRGLAG